MKPNSKLTMIGFVVVALILTVTCMGVILFATPLWAADAPAATAPAEGEKHGESLTEVNKKLSNPISSTWSIQFQQNNYLLDPGPGQSLRWNSNLNFQPVMPVPLTSNWNLITRIVLPLFNSQPHPDPHNPTNIERTTGFGDTAWMEMLSPSPKLVGGNWLLGLGPTFILPTASTDWTGQDKWQVGPAVVVGYLSKKWMLGAFVQNWTSTGGSGDRGTNQMNLQPIATYFLPHGWSFGYSGNVLANWKAGSAGDTWTVPLGLNVAKVVNIAGLHVKLQLAGQYMVHQPDHFGQKWNIQWQMTPVIPDPIKRPLFGD